VCVPQERVQGSEEVREEVLPRHRLYQGAPGDLRPRRLRHQRGRTIWLIVAAEGFGPCTILSKT
jgi:hypothetical protein